MNSNVKSKCRGKAFWQNIALCEIRSKAKGQKGKGAKGQRSKRAIEQNEKRAKGQKGKREKGQKGKRAKGQKGKRTKGQKILEDYSIMLSLISHITRMRHNTML